jgi:hypothetical protein
MDQVTNARLREPVVDDAAGAAALHDAGGAKMAQSVRNRVLACPDRERDVTDAEFVDVAQRGGDSRPRRVAENPEQLGQLARVFGRRQVLPGGRDPLGVDWVRVSALFGHLRARFPVQGV